jgi:hypothetical protein
LVEKKSALERDPALKTFFKDMMDPYVSAISIVEVAKNYFKYVEKGKIEYPAHRRKNSSVKTIWADVRIEALHEMFGFGQADIMLLADRKRQLELINCFINEKPHLQWPQPRGETIPDTLQAIWQIYIYLHAVGSEVCDKETDGFQLKKKGKDIITDFTIEIVKLRDQYMAFEEQIKNPNSECLSLPPTIFCVLFKDVTAKTKSIALSAIFGPYYEGGITALKNTMREQGAEESDIKRFEDSVDLVMKAVEPEDIKTL